jgi:hypothetical protein
MERHRGFIFSVQKQLASGFLYKEETRTHSSLYDYVVVRGGFGLLNQKSHLRIFENQSEILVVLC